MTTPKNILITHTDLDGIGNAIAAKLFHIPISEYKFCDYADLYDNSEENFIMELPHENIDVAYITDIACNQSMYDYLKSIYSTFYVFDHHLHTAQIADNDNVFYDNAKSGSEIFFEWLRNNNSKRVPMIWNQFFRLITVYDTWLLEDPQRKRAECLNYVFYKSCKYNNPTYGNYSFFVNSQVKKLTSGKNKYRFDLDEQKKIKKAWKEEREALAKAKRNLQHRVDERDNKYMIYYGSSKISFICTELLRMYPENKYIINFNTFKQGDFYNTDFVGKISVRSSTEGDFNVTTLNGVHGHEHSGGGQKEVDFLNKMWHNKDISLGYKENE